MEDPNPAENIDTLQSLTGKYRGLQGNPCNENRDPAMRTGVKIDLQGVPCKRLWVCSVRKTVFCKEPCLIHILFTLSISKWGVQRNDKQSSLGDMSMILHT